MIALAAHEEEGPREVCEDPAFGMRGECSLVSEEPVRDFGTVGRGAGEASGVRPAGAFLEELRLGLLSACTGMFDHGRFPAG